MAVITPSFYKMPRIFVNKSDTMTHLIRMVKNEYYFYTQGVCTPIQARKLAYKFQDRYDISRPSYTRIRRKKNGVSNAFMVIWKDSKSRVYWWLFATEGEGFIHDLEQLKDLRKKHERITLTGYELVLTPRNNHAPQWGWCMETSTIEAWKYRITKAIRHKNENELRQAIFSLRRVPGFSEIRKKGLALFGFAKSEYDRVYKDNQWPFGNPFIGWRGKWKKAKMIELKDLGN